MNFCSECGSVVAKGVPEGDDKERFICTQCGTVHYQNPNMVAGAVIMHNGRILLCKRAIEPCRGKWTIPAGYLENGETLKECAKRESFEEAGATICNMRHYVLVNLPFINQVYFIYRAELANNDYAPGVESLELKFVSPDEIPWDDLAFDVVREVLQIFTADLQKGHYPFREFDIHSSRFKKKKKDD